MEEDFQENQENEISIPVEVEIKEPKLSHTMNGKEPDKPSFGTLYLELIIAGIMLAIGIYCMWVGFQTLVETLKKESE